jgi:pimeloyl-ACP methyl ester carboxylesterase
MSATYVLVPGAGGDSHYWDLVAPLLRDAGHEVLTPDLPAADEQAGLAEYADVIVDAVGEREGIVLVAQSMGALSAPIAATRLDVAQLVLVAPLIPAPGESFGEWWSATGQGQAARELAVAEGRDPDAPFDDDEVFFHDVPPDVVEALLAHGESEEDGRSLEDPFPLPAWPDVATRVIAGRRDRLLPLPLVQRLARERLGVEAEVVDAGHLPALAAPGELAAALRRPR